MFVKRFMLGLCVSLVGLLTAVPAPLAGEGKDPHKTGCKRPTDDERKRALKGAAKVGGIRLNKLGLERVNAARKERGLPELTQGEAKTAAMGAEIETGQAAAAAPAATATLPAHVDNSELKYFPPIRSQGALGSCAQFSSVYYTMTHMIAMANNWDAKNGGDGFRFSPKWTYNVVNGGQDWGSYHYDAYWIAIYNGLATWQQLPYDNDYTSWCLDTNVWRSALTHRGKQWGIVQSLETDAGLAELRQLLANGYVLNFGTYVYSWQYKQISDDPSTTADDALAGRYCCYWVNGTGGAHSMTVVGYDDNIWVDINGNGQVDAGEKGAFRIANSWGDTWMEGGFTWMSYDALKPVSAVSGGPADGRQEGWWFREACWCTGREAYVPKLVAEFTVNQLQRNQLSIAIGAADAPQTAPADFVFSSAILNYSGGALAFNGTTTACDGTFVLDCSDLLDIYRANSGAQSVNKRWFLRMSDNTQDNLSTLKAFKLVDYTNGREAACTGLPKTTDNSYVDVWIDYNYGVNHPPVISGFSPLTPLSLRSGDEMMFNVEAWDSDGDWMTYFWYFDGKERAETGPQFVYRPTAAEAGKHQLKVVVSDLKGGTTSQAWDITVIAAAPTIVTQPENVNTLNGRRASFKVVASDSQQLTYQWYRNGAAIVGATGSGYTTPILSAADNGSKYKVVVKNNALSVTSREALLTLNSVAETAWVDDYLPTGAVPSASGGDAWTWTTGAPAPYSGSRSHASAVYAGIHQHLFTNATQALDVKSGDRLFAYVWLDPLNPPQEVMLQWNDGTSWNHRAYWGANKIAWGTSGTASCRYAGPLPAAGGWVRLEVPACLLGLEGRKVSGMAFTLFGGRAWWDRAGKCSSDVTWIDDALPLGAAPSSDGGDTWTWIANGPLPFSGAKAHISNIAAGEHQHLFRGATQVLQVANGDRLFAYVWLDPVNPPQEIMLQWNDGANWEHRAYWGANKISWGVDGTASRKYMGPLPPAGQWVRLEVCACSVGLSGKTLKGMSYTLYGGRAAWDSAGKTVSQ